MLTISSLEYHIQKSIEELDGAIGAVTELRKDIFELAKSDLPIHDEFTLLEGLANQTLEQATVAKKYLDRAACDSKPNYLQQHAALIRFMNSLEKFSAPIPTRIDKAEAQKMKMRLLGELNRSLENARNHLAPPQFGICERLYGNVVGEKLSWKG